VAGTGIGPDRGLGGAHIQHTHKQVVYIYTNEKENTGVDSKIHHER